jgi:rare lipoprotein A
MTPLPFLRLWLAFFYSVALMPPLPILRMVKTVAVFLLLATAVVATADPDLEGLASWYGGKFHGRMTSSGEIFDTNEMTAAHKTLPFGTIVKVTNLDNGKSATVKINDRGPFIEGRIIDLSRAAAEQIDMVGQGVAPVALTIVAFATGAELYAIQVGAFAVDANAQKARSSLEGAGFVVTVEKTALGISRVSVRGITAKELAASQKRIADLGFASYMIKKEKTEAPQVTSAAGGSG